MKQRKNSLTESFQKLFKLAEHGTITLRSVMQTLAGKGHALLLILFSLPFCFLIPLPGVSTPFGIILMFIGLRIAFRHKIWLPKQLLEKKISTKTLKHIAKYAIAITDKMRFMLSTRMVWLFDIPWFHIVHGLVIAFLALLLVIPLPLPLTNTLVAFPILLFGLALLKDDGLMLILAYFFSFIGLVGFGLIFYYGAEGIKSIFSVS